MTSELLTPNKNYNKMRVFLRLLFLNGCYSKTSFKKYNLLSDKQYRNYTNILMEYFNDDCHNLEQYSRDSLQLNFEYHETTENYLVDSYLTKSSTSNYMSVYFLLLQILNTSERPLKRTEITEVLYRIYGFDDISSSDCSKEISESSIYNYLKEFVHLDILVENEDNEFYLNDDIFKDLSNKELISLCHAISFFSNVLYPSTPGYFLKNSLEKYIKYTRHVNLEDKNIFLHRFTPLHSVLDDEIVLESLKAIKNNRKIKVQYEKLVFHDSHYKKESHKIKLYPIKVIFDFSLGRWYLACLDDENTLSMLRIDRINRINILKDTFDYKMCEDYFNEQFKDIWTASTPLVNDKYKEIKLKIPKENKHTLKRLMKEGQNGQLILGEDNNYYFTLNVIDDIELLPWIRTLSPYVQIIENTDLKDRFVGDLIEMRDSYEII